jgi:hypothetical protein
VFFKERKKILKSEDENLRTSTRSKNEPKFGGVSMWCEQ